MKKEKGFTLIELLAVIIILGVLMIIAIPSVTKYINDSRKSGYINSAKEIINGARMLVTSGNLEIYDKDTTYYIDSKCINTEKTLKSPYGEINKAYVVVIYDGDNYEYYWTSVDETGQGIKGLINDDNLDIDNISGNISANDISTLRGIDGREKSVVIEKENNCQKEEAVEVTTIVNSDTGDTAYVCKPATTLHTTTCRTGSNEVGCGVSIGNGNTITYGTLVNGEPKPGDAYDCKVTKNGDFTERFYYLGSSGNKTLLIHYKNVNNSTRYPYDLSGENWHGPRTAYQYLPSISEWNNPGIIAPGTRQILSQEGGITVYGGNQIESFTYTNKAGRLPTTQEIESACSTVTPVTTIVDGELDGCEWLMEGIGRFERDNGDYGYWSETPYTYYNNEVWFVRPQWRQIHHNYVELENSYGVRPVITILTTSLMQ